MKVFYLLSPIRASARASIRFRAYSVPLSPMTSFPAAPAECMWSYDAFRLRIQLVDATD